MEIDVRQQQPAPAKAGDALDALAVGITSTKVNWILDADIRSFFDMVSQDWLIRFLELRIGDRRIIRLVQKWLRAGVLEDGAVTVSERGTGQGSVISPPAFAGAGCCLPTSTCTMSSTSGPTAGDGGRRPAT